jgi:hypothetical protein
MAGSVDAMASDAFLPPGVDVSLPAIPSQLPPGSKPGTFHFSEPVLVEFKQQQEFPVDLVIRDYSHKEVFRYLIKKPELSILNCDLTPGSYDQVYEMVGNAKKDYLDWHDNRTIFITPNGQYGRFQGTTFQPLSYGAFTGRYPYDAVFRRRIETIEPANKAQVSSGSIHFRWKPIPGVEEYTVSAMPIQNLDHPESCFSAERQTKVVHGCDFTIQSGLKADQWNLNPGESYVWVVENGNDEDEISRHIAQSELGTFCVQGRMAQMGPGPPTDFMRDEAVEPRLKVRLQQPYIPSDGGDAIFCPIVVAVGDGSPLLKAGLGVGARIIRLNEISTLTLTKFHEVLAAIPSGRTVPVEVMAMDPKNFKPTRISYPVLIP